MLGPPAGSPGTSTCPKPEPRSETYATAHAWISGSSGSGADARTQRESEWRTSPPPMRVGVTSRTSTRNGDGRRALFGHGGCGDHREDDLTVLNGSNVARRERTTVPVAVDVKDHGA